MKRTDTMSATNILPGTTVSAGRVLAVCVGNGLEFYDFLAYTLFAVYIGRAFFPTRSGSLSLLLSVATFGIGFVTRPLGALIIGRLGDRVGRRPAMLLSFLMMGAGTLTLAVTPRYASIGLAAPALIILSRLVQGFALGGDVGPTTAYMVEMAPPTRRGLYGSLQFTTQQVATLAVAVLGVALTRALSPAALSDWGWRVAFLFGVMIVLLGLRLRSSLPETLQPQVSRAGVVAESPRLRPLVPVIACVALLLASGTIGVYILNDLTTYALTTLHIAPTRAFLISVVTSLSQALGYLLSGWLSDRAGRRPLIRAGVLLTALLVLPTFVLIGHHPAALLLYSAVGLLAACSGVMGGPILVALTEAVPPAVRSGVVALTYAVAIAVFGGSTQFVITWLIQRTGSPLAPAWYWTVALLAGLAAALYIPETAPGRARPAAAVSGETPEAFWQQPGP